MEVLPPDLKAAYQDVYDGLTPAEQAAWAETAKVLGLNTGGTQGPGQTEEIDGIPDPDLKGLAYSKDEATEIVNALQLLFGEGATGDLSNPTPEQKAAMLVLAEYEFPTDIFDQPVTTRTIASLFGLENWETITEDQLRAELTAAGITLPPDFFEKPLDPANIELLGQIAQANTVTREDA
ncbi:hypothetical protein GCM10007276_31280 [Agaricicola taiwanensis]|uniref:Uncharacterized protein n=1 Tax=Agaricicola taiwanensis TaxID=591372 RepID=A0A8J3DZR1_9RHOB|nr:hypothetical protein [Agaricicola taiwanensis]GGE51950.1 hypothetical protein GCM10007276_31280 [Agaricicola taiwanensis]